jgi:hypothetical protein
MYQSDATVTGVLTNPNQLWLALDSFWRQYVVTKDADLVRYQTYATLITYLYTYSTSQHFIGAQAIQTIQPFAVIPFYPIVIYKDRLVNSSYYLYGDPGLVYGGGINYGDQNGSAYKYPIIQNIKSFGCAVDSVVATRTVLDNASLSYDSSNGVITFKVDPFTILTPSVLASTDREYVIIWLKNVELDLNVPFDWLGWILELKDTSDQPYVDALKALHSLIEQGPSIAAFSYGLSAAAAFPVARESETVTDVVNDGWQRVIITDKNVYRAPIALNSVVTPGEAIVANQPLTDGVKFYGDKYAISSASFSDIPGLAINIPLSTGQIAELFFPNQAHQWTYDVARPSPWRFPVGGESQDVEQFWIDCWSRQTSTAVFLSTIYGLIPPGPGPAVNPMQLVIGDLIENAIFIASVDMQNLGDNIAGFADRAKQLMPASSYVIIQQAVGNLTDSIALADVGSDSVVDGMHVGDPTDSLTGRSTDYTPGVFAY